MATATFTARRNQNLYRQPAAKLQLGPISATFVTIALISVLAVLYLNQVTKTSVLGYRLTSLQTQESQVVAAQQQMTVDAARLSSLSQIQSSSAVAGMTAANSSQITYAQ